MKLLLDENLSPAVALTLAKEDGVDACHVRDRAMLGLLALIRAAIRFIEDNGNDMVNRVLWVNIDGTMEIEDISSE